MGKIKENIKTVSLRWGLYLGVTLIVITCLALFINWDLLLSPWFQFSKFIITAALAIYATSICRRIYFRQFSFRDGFTGFFITVVVGLGVFHLANWMLFDLLASDAGHYINDSAIKLRQEQLEALGQDSDKIEEAIKSLKSSYQFALLNQFKGYITNLILYCLLAPLVAVIFKTKKPIIR